MHTDEINAFGGPGCHCDAAAIECMRQGVCITFAKTVSITRVTMETAYTAMLNRNSRAPSADTPSASDLPSFIFIGHTIVTVGSLADGVILRGASFKNHGIIGSLIFLGCVE